MQTSWILGTGNQTLLRMERMGRSWKHSLFWETFQLFQAEMPHPDKSCSCRIVKGEGVMVESIVGGHCWTPMCCVT